MERLANLNTIMFDNIKSLQSLLENVFKNNSQETCFENELKVYEFVLKMFSKIFFFENIFKNNSKKIIFENVLKNNYLKIVFKTKLVI